MKNDSKYKHGGTPQLDMIRLGVSAGPVLDFSVNLNPLGPPAIIRENWPDLIQCIEHYPSVEGDGVAAYYESACGIAPKNFLAGNGSTELIYLTPRALKFKRAAVMAPSFHDYERASLLAGAEVVKLPLSRNDHFAFPTADRIVRTLKDVDALWIARPNNPTGNLFSKDLILDLADRFPEKWFVVDEAFIQFLDHWKSDSLLMDKPRPNILVLNSLTKFYSIAGLRLGGIVGDEAVISRLRSEKEPWAVNGIADRVASLLVRCSDYDDQTRSLVKKERARLFQTLERLDGITPFSPTANYILCQWTKSPDLDDLLKHLLSRGLYLRDCRNFPGLKENFFRIGLKKPEENDRFFSALSSFP